MKSFLLKAKYFFKRNIYPITVSCCTVLILAIVTVSAYNSIKEENIIPDVNVEVSKPSEDVIIDTSTNSKEEENKNPENVKPTVSSDPIVFELPFNSATITKKFADTSLLYDNTTKYWRTHQGLDFACSEGTQVVAVFDGTIEKIESSMMNGTMIYLRISEDLVVIYKGLSTNVFVKEGDKVTKGVVLGSVTSFLAEKADGVHLNLELIKKDVMIDPTEYFSFKK